jgi:hypothetical protein
MQVDPSGVQRAVWDEIGAMSMLTVIGMGLVYVAARIHPRAGQWVFGVIAGFVLFLAFAPQMHLVTSLVSAYFLFAAYLGGTGQLKGEPAPPPAPPTAQVRPPAPVPAPPPAPQPALATRAEPADTRPARVCHGCGAGAREGSQCAYCGRPV